MKKDKYYFEIDGEKVLEVTPVKVPVLNAEIDQEVFNKIVREAAKKIQEQDAMMPTGSYEDPYWFFSSSELYKIEKEQNMLDENDIGYNELDGHWYKTIVCDIEEE